MQGGETPPQGMTLTEAVNKAKELAASGNRQGAADLLKKAREFASSEEGSLRIPQPAPKVEFTPAELAQMGDPEARKALISQPDFMDKMVAMHAANEAPAETLKNLSQKPGEAVKWVKSVLSPLSMSPVGEIAGYLFRGKLGEYYQAHKMLRTAFKTIADEFKGMSEGDRLKFILRLQNNMPQATERLNEFADLFRSTLDQYYGAVRNYKQSLPYIEQYFPQYWRKGEKAAADILGKKSLEGSKAFTRERIFGDILDGIANGHQLKTTNPAELFMMKVDEYEKFLMGQRLIEEMKGLNLVKSLGEGEKAQHGWVKINDKMGGGLWAHPDAGRIINNYLSPTAYSTVGAPFKWYMGMSNLLNQAQLGLGAFHGGFTTMEAAISTGATGLKEISSLDPSRMRRGIAMLGKSAALPYSVAENISRGSKFMSDLVATTPLEANKQKIVDMWKASGLRFEMDKGLKLNAIEKVKQAADDVRSGRLQGLFTGAVNTPGAILELAAKPVMESLVPRQKAGVFSLMADTWIKAHPNASHMEMVKAANEMANRVEGRLGQVNYERLFVNNGFKNAVQAIVRSPGWRGGTLVELGGAITDTLGQGGRLLSKGAEKVTSGAIKSNLGKFEGLTDRQAYALSLGLFHATLSGLITATVMAAKEDKPLDQIFSELQPLDFIMPRTGGIDEHGNPERVNLPDYAKDVYAYGKSYGASIVHGAHPMIGVLSDLIRNKDYGGQTIRPRDEDAAGQAWSAGKYIVKSFMPFSLRNVQREGERQGEEGVAEIASNPSFKKAAPFIGITPAPAGLYNTPMMEYIYETQRLARPEGGEREADLEKNKEMRRALALQRTGKQDESLSILKQNLSEGKIGKSDIEGYVNKVKYGPIIGPYIRMDWQTALKAYALGNEQERQQVLPFLVKKIAGMKDRPQGEQAAAYSALRAIATDRQGVTWKQIQDAMRNPMLEKEAQSQ
jgi:hypothetical protein